MTFKASVMSENLSKLRNAADTNSLDPSIASSNDFATGERVPVDLGVDVAAYGTPVPGSEVRSLSFAYTTLYRTETSSSLDPSELVHHVDRTPRECFTSWSAFARRFRHDGRLAACEHCGKHLRDGHDREQFGHGHRATDRLDHS